MARNIIDNYAVVLFTFHYVSANRANTSRLGETLKRSIAIAAIVAATSLGITGTSEASASPVKAASVSSAPVAASLPTVFPTVSWHWWGLSYRYNKTATQMIAAGGVAYGGFVIGGKITAAVASAMLGAYASSAADFGNCLGLNIPWSAGTAPWKMQAYITQC